jgi:hypothetical protein
MDVFFLYFIDNAKAFEKLANLKGLVEITFRYFSYGC